MTAPILDPTVPLAAADWLDSHEWVQAAGNGKTSGCLHTALLRPCSTPGDQIIWHLLERQRGHSEAWNDEPGRTKGDVLAVLRPAVEPTAAEMTVLFGPQWEAVRDLVRRAAVLTADEAARLHASWVAACVAAWDAAGDVAIDGGGGAAWDTSIVAAIDAARDAAGAAAWGAAWDTSIVAAIDAARDAAGAAAWGAAGALVIRDLIGQHGFKRAHYDALTMPWRTVIGPLHPDDKGVTR